MKKRLILTVVLIFMLTNITGCWNRVELDKRAFVVAFAIDKAKEKGKVMITAQILKPAQLSAPATGGGGNEEKAIWVVSSTGHTVFEAIRNFTMQTSRKLYSDHNRILIIGEDIAREGVLPVIDLFIRDPEPQPRTWVLISKGKASDILRAESKLENIPAMGIEDLISTSKATSMASAVDMHQFVLKLLSKTTSPVASRIELIEEKSNEPPMVRLTGTAVFKKDNLVGWLNRPETRGLLWIINEVKSGIIVVKSPKEENKNVSLEIMKASSKIKPEIKDGELIIVIEVNEEGNIGSQESSVNLSTPDMIMSLEKRKEEVIKNEIFMCLKKAQKEFRSDIFGFGEEIHRSFPEEWKKIKNSWDEVFPNIKVEVKVNTKIKLAGMITEPIAPVE